jgi:hypothetical protein
VTGELDRLWREKLQPWLDSLEDERRAATRLFWTLLPLGIVLGAGLGALALRYELPHQFVLLAFFGIPVLVGAFGAHRLSKLADRVKLRLLDELARISGLEYAPKPYLPSRFARFQEHGLLPGHHRRHFEDHFEGAFHGADFELYEAKLERRYRTKNGTRYQTVFRGVLIRIGFPRKVKGVTVITRDKGWFNGLEAFGRSFGSRKLERIGLVDPRFEKAFEVYGNDQVMARYMLTPSLMERLLALEAAFKGKNVRAVFDENSGRGELLIAAETGDQFELSSVFNPIPDRSEVVGVLEEIRLVTEIIDLLVRPAKFGEHETGGEPD